MAIKETFGEVSKKDLINLGDRVTVKYLKEGQNEEEEITGILMKATTEKITINGTAPTKEIKIDQILEIKETE